MTDAPKKTAPVFESSGAREIALADLLGDARDIAILHAGKRYLLRLTRQNRLLLTKDPEAETGASRAQ